MRKNLDFFIKKYLENRPLFYSLIRPQEALLFYQNKKYLKPPILDFGCGDGFFAKTVFGKKKIDIGLDLKNSRADEAEKNKIYKKIIYYDGEKIPFPDNYFSTIISNCVLEHIPNLKKSLKEIKRVLKPDSYFLTTVMTNKWEDYLFGKKIFGQRYIKFMRKKQIHFNLLSKNEWVSHLKKAGFQQIKTIYYLTKKQSGWLDILHYFSLPSLLTYRLTDHWIIWPKWYKYFFIDKLIKKIFEEKNKKESAALFLSCKN